MALVADGFAKSANAGKVVEFPQRPQALLGCLAWSWVTRARFIELEEEPSPPCNFLVLSLAASIPCTSRRALSKDSSVCDSSCFCAPAFWSPHTRRSRKCHSGIRRIHNGAPACEVLQYVIGSAKMDQVGT